MLILRMVWWMLVQIVFSPQPCKALYMTTRTLRGAGQGPVGGCTLVYMYLYTDQENATVNHYTHRVVYIYTGPITVTKLAI